MTSIRLTSYVFVLAVLVVPASASAATLPAGTTAAISGTPDLRGLEATPVADSRNDAQALDRTGARVAFTSSSDGLVAGDDDDVRNVYVKDVATGTVTLVSRAAGAAGEPAHADCSEAAISADGTHVAFTCEGSLDPADTNTVADVYLRDLTAQTTTLVSRASALGPVGNTTSSRPAIDANGAIVAFETDATNLGGGIPASPRVERIYLRGIGDGDPTRLVSRAGGANGQVAQDDAQRPSISDDGVLVAFDTDSSLEPDDANGVSDVYVRDVAGVTTTLASRADGANGAPGNGPSSGGHLSGNGAFVAFTSEADQLDRAGDQSTDPDAYRRALAAGTTQLISTTSGATKGNEASLATGIDASGEVVAFVTGSNNLDPADTTAGGIDVYVRRGNALVLASRGDGGSGPPDNDAFSLASVSANGTTVAFTRAGSSLSALSRVDARDLDAARTRTVSVPTDPAQALNAGGEASGGSVSANGRFVAFLSTAPAFGVPAGFEGVFVRDTLTGVVTLVSRADGANGAILRGVPDEAEISADGQRVAFAIGSGQGAGFEDVGPAQVYVRDLRFGRTILVSRADGANGAKGNAFSVQPSISHDGSRVAFLTEATNVGDGDTDATADVHVRLVDAGRTLLASRATGAAGAKGNGRTDNPALSGDGRSVAFSTVATNLADGDADAISDIHVRRIDAGQTQLVSVAGDATKGDEASDLPSIDRDGDRVAFRSRARNLLAGNSDQQIYVRAIAARTLTLAGRADGANGGRVVGNRVGPARVSADGTSVAFEADPFASLAPGAPADGFRRVYERVLATGVTRLISRRTGADGAAVTEQAGMTLGGISADGGCVTFSGPGRVLAPPASSDFSQVYLRAVRADCGRASQGGGGGAPGPGTGGPGTGGPGAGPGPVGQGPGTTRDSAAPRLTKARLSHTRFRAGRKATALSAAAPSGTVLSLRSSEAARLTITVEREVAGRRKAKGRPCKRVHKRPRKGACTAFARDATLRRTLIAGTSRITFSGRVGSKRLATGRHRMTLVSRDAAGNRSKSVTLRFTVVTR